MLAALAVAYGIYVWWSREHLSPKTTIMNTVTVVASVLLGLGLIFYIGLLYTGNK